MICEYLVDHITPAPRKASDTDGLQTTINQYGRNGWELVAAYPSDEGVVVVFKRPHR